MLAGRPKLRIVLQVMVSLALLTLVFTWAGTRGVLTTLQGLSVPAIAGALGLYALCTVLNSYRWQVLLHKVGIQACLGRLTALFLIGQFFSLFLPTGIGGDVVRVYQVARRSGKTAAAFLATLQDRVLAFAATIFTGLAATWYFFPQLPTNLRAGLVIGQALGGASLILLLYPRALLAVAGVFGFRLDRPVKGRVLARIHQLLYSLIELPHLTLLSLVANLALALTQVLLGVGVAYVLGRSFNLPVGFWEFCLIIPLVWLVRMVPISLNGYGVTEGSFVFFLSLFGVSPDQGLSLALVMLAVQISMPLVGGLVLAVQTARGGWISSPDVRPPGFAAELGSPAAAEAVR